MKTAKHGDRVYDKADRRHVGVVKQVVRWADGTFTATVRWEETGWLSFKLPLRDLRRAPREPGPQRSPMFLTKRAIAARCSV